MMSTPLSTVHLGNMRIDLLGAQALYCLSFKICRVQGYVLKAMGKWAEREIDREKREAKRSTWQGHWNACAHIRLMCKVS